MNTSFLIQAGDGNRTHVISLEGWSSTIELHPHNAQSRNRTSDTRIFSPLLYRLSYLGSCLLSYFCDSYTLPHHPEDIKIFLKKFFPA